MDEPVVVESIRELVRVSTINAIKKGYNTSWKLMTEYCIPTQLCWAAGELTGEAFAAWRNDDKTNFLEEIADAFIVLGHTIGDIDAVDEFLDILTLKLKYNELRPYKHGYKQLKERVS